jgi:hypothetical protein
LYTNLKNFGLPNNTGIINLSLWQERIFRAAGVRACSPENICQLYLTVFPNIPIWQILKWKYVLSLTCFNKSNISDLRWSKLKYLSRWSKIKLSNFLFFNIILFTLFLYWLHYALSKCQIRKHHCIKMISNLLCYSFLLQLWSVRINNCNYNFYNNYRGIIFFLGKNHAKHTNKFPAHA